MPELEGLRGEIAGKEETRTPPGAPVGRHGRDHSLGNLVEADLHEIVSAVPWNDFMAIEQGFCITTLGMAVVPEAVQRRAPMLHIRLVHQDTWDAATRGAVDLPKAVLAETIGRGEKDNSQGNHANATHTELR